MRCYVGGACFIAGLVVLLSWAPADRFNVVTLLGGALSLAGFVFWKDEK